MGATLLHVCEISVVWLLWPAWLFPKTSDHPNPAFLPRSCTRSDQGSKWPQKLLPDQEPADSIDVPLISGSDKDALLPWGKPIVRVRLAFFPLTVRNTQPSHLEWHFVHSPPLVEIAPDAIFWARIVHNLMLFTIIFVLFSTFTQQSRNHIEDIEQHRMSIETLLKEIHHRIKNNLQVVTSLLALQSIGIKEQKIQNLFKDLKNRINSMALSHEMLYKTDDL